MIANPLLSLYSYINWCLSGNSASPDSNCITLCRDGGPMIEKSSSTERRTHPRYNVGDNVLVFSHDTFGQILNISKSGLAYRYLTTKDDTIAADVELGFLNTESGFYLDKLTIRLNELYIRMLALVNLAARGTLQASLAVLPPAI
jgi:hypothetical protein